MTLGERVKLVRKERGWSQAEVAKRVTKLRREKTTQVAIHHIETRGDVNPRFVVELAQALEVNLDWLRNERGPRTDAEVEESATELSSDDRQPLPASALPPPQTPLPDDRQRANPLPVWASAEGGEEGAMLITSGPIDYIPRPRSLQVTGAFAVYLVGSSMSPAYEHGDMLYIHPHRPVQGGDDCLFIQQLDDGSLLGLAKRLVRRGTDKWRVRQFNPDKDFDLDRRRWAKAWVIVGKMNRAS